jgi:osmotically-inducible protein OsmY
MKAIRGQSMTRKCLQWIVVLLVVGLLSACANVAISGAQAVYNHKALEKNLNDHVIALKATHTLNRPRFKDTNISVAVLNADVLLSGEAPEAWQKEQARELVSKIDGISHLYNLITVSGRASALSQASDTWITAKVKSKIIASYDIDATRVKVVTEKGVVFLMGTVLPEEAEAAADIASTTDGVTSVVKLFSYMKISKTV